MPHEMHALNAHAKMYYRNSVRLNKTKISWKGCVLFITLQLYGRCTLYNHFDAAIVEHSLLDYVSYVVANNY